MKTSETILIGGAFVAAGALVLLAVKKRAGGPAKALGNDLAPAAGAGGMWDGAATRAYRQQLRAELGRAGEFWV